MEGVHLLVKDESKHLKNFAFNVPLTLKDLNKPAMKKPPTSPTMLLANKRKRTLEQGQSTGRVRSASTGRDKKSELHARYWAFLFGNLQRAVDEIYQTCESDESVSQCKEVMMVLDTYSRDFRNLIDWFKIKWDYETTPPPQRPISLAWEIRKSSPGKIQGMRTPEPLLIEAVRRKIPFLDSAHSSKTSSTVNSGDESSTSDHPLDSLGSEMSSSIMSESIEQLAKDLKEEGKDEKRVEVIYEEKRECEMVDEVCQTDREEDVDENGPKYRSVSLQTCPELCPEDIEKTLKPKQAEVKEEKTLRSNILISKVGNGAPVTKSPARANTSISVSKPAWGAGGGLPKFTPTARTSTSKPPYSTVPRQPWGSRPAPTTPVRQNVANKLMRSKTAGEVRSRFSDNGIPNSRLKPALSTSKSPLAPSSSLARSNVAACPKSKTTLPISNSTQNIKSHSNERRNSGNKCDDHISYSNSSSSLHSSGSSCTVITAEVNSATQSKANLADEDGWVKVRSRSRFSPANKLEVLDSSLSRSASNLKPKSAVVRHQAKTRYHLPSSAKSLPSLAFASGHETRNVGLDKQKINKTPKIKKSPAPELKKKSAKTFEKYIEDCGKNEKTVDELTNEVNDDADLPSQTTLSSDLEDKKNALIDTDDEENKFAEEMKKNSEAEELLQKEITELESADIEMDMETGDEETDGETTETTGTEDEPESDRDVAIPKYEGKTSPKKLYHYETLMKGLSWADHMETLDALEKLVVQNSSKEGMTADEQLDTLERLEVFLARHPGRAMELHQKLSSPSRKRSIPDTVKRFQARQAKASAKREALQSERAQKLRELLKKVNEVKAAKEKLIEDRRIRLDMKLERATAKRNLYLKEIMRKAHDEEEKLKEIAFINELEARNKRHDLMLLRQKKEDSLQGIHEERQRKQEEKAAKEAAVEERRKAIEAERQEKLEKMQERQRLRDEQVDKKKQEKEKERQELAREKARDRTERLEALHVAQLEAQEELQKKIQLKQEESARRHEENIEQIRQKALELSILRCGDDIPPRLVPYDTKKLCTVCNVLIGSEVYLLSHLRGRAHLEAMRNQRNGGELTKEEIEKENIKVIVNAPADKIDPKIAADRERIRSFKKKCKKIRLRMIAKSEDYMKKVLLNEKEDSPSKSKLQKRLKEIEKLAASQGKGQWADTAVTALERAVGDIRRTLAKKDASDQSVFKNLRGFQILCDILQLDMDVPARANPYLPQKCFVTICSTLLAALADSVDNCKFLILSNHIATVLDVLYHRLSILLPDKESRPSGLSSSLPFDALANVSMGVVSATLVSLKDCDIDREPDEFAQRLRNVLSYTVSVGIVDKLTKYCSEIRDPIDDDSTTGQFLLSGLHLLATLTTSCKQVRKGGEDTTQLLVVLQVTELVGAVSILYGMLLHQDAPPRDCSSQPPLLPSATVAVVQATIQLLRSVAQLDLPTFQSILGAEGASLQFRHIASYLLWYCSNDREKALLHEVISIVGYFAVQHRDNQMILQAGTNPTVLQQLCNLPFPYFCNPDLSALLFPTLLACCCGNEENKVILQQEISYSLLEDFLTTETAKNHPLVKLLNLSNLKNSN